MAGPYLLKRRAGWYVRIRIPVGLTAILGSHLTRSLRTRDYRLARRRAVAAVAALQLSWSEVVPVMASSSGNGQDLAQMVEALLGAERRWELADEAALARSLRTYLVAPLTTAFDHSEDAAPSRGPQRPVEEALAEARLQGRLDGMKEAMALLGTPAAASVGGVAGGGAPPTGETLRADGQEPWSSLVERFFVARPSIGASARVSHVQAFRDLKAVIGDKPAQAVSKGDIARYVEWLESKPNGRSGRAQLSQASIVKMLQHVRGFFGWAEEKAYIASNPALGVRPRTANLGWDTGVLAITSKAVTATDATVYGLTATAGWDGDTSAAVSGSAPGITVGGVVQSASGFTTTGAITTSQVIDPFSGVTISESVTGVSVTATITFAAADGTLTGTGLSGSNGSLHLGRGDLRRLAKRLAGTGFYTGPTRHCHHGQFLSGACRRRYRHTGQRI